MTAPKTTAVQKSFAPGQYLFHEGEPSNSMFLVQKGTVAIRKHKGSAYIELARLYSNEVLGELSFFDRQPRSATAVALTDVEVLEIQFESLDKVYVNVPDYLKAIMASVADRLRHANDTIRRLQKNVASESGVEPVGESSPPEFANLPEASALDGIPSDIPVTSRDESSEDPRE